MIENFPSELVKHGSHPEAVGRFLCTWARKQVRAETILLFLQPDPWIRDGYRLLGQTPGQEGKVRHQEDIRLLAEFCSDFRLPLILEPGARAERAGDRILHRMRYRTSMAVPLNFLHAKVGVLFLLNLPDRCNLFRLEEKMRAVTPHVTQTLHFSILLERNDWIIDERNRALQRSRDQYRLLTEMAPVGIIRTNLEGDGIHANALWCKITGKTLEEAARPAWMTGVHPEDRDRVRQAWHCCAEEDRGFQMQYRIQRPDESELGVICRVEPEREDGHQRIGYLCTLSVQAPRDRDLHGAVTDPARKVAPVDDQQKRILEQQVLSNRKLDSLGKMAGGIAHDFNNILSCVLGNADLVLMELPEHAAIRENLEEIKRASLRASDLTHQMLTFSGKGRAFLEPLDLNGLIEEMKPLLKTIPSHRIGMQYDLADSLPRIDADATQMHQVVMNLTANATEAIGERRGVITIRTRGVRGDRDLLAQNCIGENPGEENYVALEVSDTGVGMDEETQVSIFDPFFSTKYTGRGLGLSSVQGIVRRHKGAIRVDSEEGRGTTFQLLFLSREEPPIIERKKEDVPSKQTGKAPLLLVADDEEGVRYVVRKMLEKQGYRVITARDGKEAVELFEARESEIDLVLLDMAMPRMNGEEAFQEMIKIRPELKVILCSGYNEQEATHRFRNGELAGFIQKPFQADQFLERVRALLEEGSPKAIQQADASP